MMPAALPEGEAASESRARGHAISSYRTCVVDREAAVDECGAFVSSWHLSKNAISESTLTFHSDARKTA